MAIKINCYMCGTERNISKKDFLASKSGKHFCSHTCAAKHNNTVRIIQKGKTKFATCRKCKKSIIVSIRAAIDNVYCRQCKKKKYVLYTKELTCVRCGIKFIAKTAKYCPACLKQVNRESGCKSALAQGDARRSKNEIHFANLCKAAFENVLENAPIFNKWDADVIIPEFKIAVLWNGNWHRQKITEKHSVKQVQSRDRIKQKEIIKAGYYPYVIEDFGKEDSKFVQDKFEEFLLWIKNTYM